jgi:protein-L-isoaspartate(D-aspartate) O-methyltransferase
MSGSGIMDQSISISAVMGICVLCAAILACSASVDAGNEILGKKIRMEYPAARKEVISAFLAIERETFLDNVPANRLYEDSVHAIGFGQVSSKPSLNVVLAQELLLEPGLKVLEVGTGSGIQAALLRRLGAEVFTVDMNMALVKKAKGAFSKLGYSGIEVRYGDGYFGWPDGGLRFDRILITCSFTDVPGPLVCQLKEGGYCLMPVGRPFENQILTRFQKRHGKMRMDKEVKKVVFVPMLLHK